MVMAINFEEYCVVKRSEIQDIADAIKEKIDNEQKLLPSQMADAIISIVGGGEVNGLKYSEGTFYHNSNDMTIDHNCGFIPEIFILYPKFEVIFGEANEEVGFVGYYGDCFGTLPKQRCGFLLENRTTYTEDCTWQLASTWTQIPIDETSIKIPYRSASYPFKKDVEYGWIAIAGKEVQSGDYDFWEIYQQGGSRTDYSFAFNGTGWNDDVLKPKYIIKPIIAQNMFSNGCKITAINDENFDFSECTNTTNLCYLNTQIREVNIDISNITNFTCGFYYCSRLHSVTLRNINSECSFLNTFYLCGALVHLNITGNIGKSISFANSAELSDTSIQNIIDGLVDLTGGTAQTLTFHKDVKAKLTEDQIATITSKNWTLA